MGQVYESQFRAMQVAFARDGIGIEIAYTPSGRPDYIYQAGRLLVDTRVNPQIIAQIEGLLIGTALAGPDEQPTSDFLRVLSIEHLQNGYLTVPEALDLIDAELGKDLGKGYDEKLAASGDYSPVTPVHALHITQDGGDDAGRVCPATEPEVPCCCAADGDCPPCPPPAPGSAGAGVLIGICDTGLLANIAQAPWLAGVTGELGPLLASVPPIPPGLHAIPHYTGHGTFVAGVARCQAPMADIYVSGAGVYTYQEPPKRPARQIFAGMARWSGTSFAAPLVAGLIAAQMSSANASAADATAMVLAQAAEQAIPGVGPALYPWHP
jgi:hypothetical protein